MSCGTPLPKVAKPIWAKQLTCGVRKISIWVYYLEQNGQSSFAGFNQFPRPTMTGI